MRNFNDLHSFLKADKIAQEGFMVRRVPLLMCGSFLTGAVLSQIMYWHQDSKRGAPRMSVRQDGQLWIAKSLNEWADELVMTYEQVRGAFRSLQELGLIETMTCKFQGRSVLHLRLEPENFMQSWENVLLQRLHETDEPVPEHRVPVPEHRVPVPEHRVPVPEHISSITETTKENVNRTTVPVPHEDRSTGTSTAEGTYDSTVQDRLNVRTLGNVQVPSSVGSTRTKAPERTKTKGEIAHELARAALRKHDRFWLPGKKHDEHSASEWLDYVALLAGLGTDYDPTDEALAAWIDEYVPWLLKKKEKGEEKFRNLNVTFKWCMAMSLMAEFGKYRETAVPVSSQREFMERARKRRKPGDKTMADVMRLKSD